MKKTIASILTVFMAATMLAACSGGAPDSSTEAETSATPNASEATSADTPSATGTFMDEIEPNAELLYWEMKWGNDQYGDATQAFVDRFNAENPYGIHVTLEMIPWDGYYQTFLTAVTTGSAPAVCTGATPTPIQYAVMGESLNLDPIMEAWAAENHPVLTDIDQAMWDFFKYEGVQYGLPYGIDPKQVHYRTDYFEEAGITTLPTTYDELLDALRQIKTAMPDKIPLLLCGGGSDSNPNQVAYVLNATNHAGFTDENLVPTMNSEPQIQNYTFIKTMYDEELISKGSAGYIMADVERMWLAGEAAVLWGPSGNFMTGREIANVTKILPNISGPNANGDGKYAQCINGVNGFNQTDYPNAARYFLKWWMENYIDLLVDTGNGNLPAGKSHYELDYFKNDPFLYECYQYTISNGIPMTANAPSLYPQFAQLEGERTFAVALAKVLTGSSVEDACNEANAELAMKMEEYA